METSSQLSPSRSTAASRVNSNDATFGLAFEAMQMSLKSILSHNSSLNDLDDQTLKDIRRRRGKLEDALSKNNRTELSNNAVERLGSVLRLRNKTLERFRKDLRCKESELDSVAIGHKTALESCLTQKLVGDRRLKQQQLTAERRIRELVFEIIGEYGKSDVRFRRRQAYLSYSARIDVAFICRNHTWNRFLRRLCFHSTCDNNDNNNNDNNSNTDKNKDKDKKKGSSGGQYSHNSQSSQHEQLRGSLLDSAHDTEEITAVEQRIAKRLRLGLSGADNNTEKDTDGGNRNSSGNSSGSRSRSIRAMTVLRLVKGKNIGSQGQGQGSGVSTTGGGGNSALRTMPPLVARCARDLQEFSSALRHWTAKPMTQASSSSSSASSSNGDKERTSTRVSIHSRGGGQLGNSGKVPMSPRRAAAALAKKAALQGEGEEEEPVLVPGFLKSSACEWLHPPSFVPHIWDKLVQREPVAKSDRDAINSYKAAKSDSDGTGTGSGAGGSSGGGVEGGGAGKLTPELDAFIDRYCMQHSAYVASQRVYYCVEERASSLGGVQSQSQSQAQAQAHGQSLEQGTNPGGRTYEELLGGLQAHYTAGTSAETDPDAVRARLYADPLQVGQYLGTHRSIRLTSSSSPLSSSSVNASASASGLAHANAEAAVHSMGKCFPDVVQTQTLVCDNEGKCTGEQGAIMHFAPATTYNLLETRAFAARAGAANANAEKGGSVGLSLSQTELKAIVSMGPRPPGLIVPQNQLELLEGALSPPGRHEMQNGASLEQLDQESYGDDFDPESPVKQAQTTQTTQSPARANTDMNKMNVNSNNNSDMNMNLGADEAKEAIRFAVNAKATRLPRLDRLYVCLC